MKKRLKSTLLPLLIILVVAIIARLIFFSVFSGAAIVQDSQSYGWAGQEILQKPFFSSLINPIRPPMYPLFLSWIMLFTGWDPRIPIETILMGTTGNVIMTIQSVVSILSCLLLYLLCKNIMPKFIAIVLSLIYCIDLKIIPWERYILTESFSISWMIGFIFLTYYTLKKPSLLTIASIFFFSIIGIFLRSTFLGLLPIVFLVIMVSHPTKKIMSTIMLFALCYVGVVGSYIVLNGHYHNNRTFQFVSSVNIFGRIMKDNLPIPTLPDNKVYRTVSYFDERDYYKHPFKILHTVNGKFYYNSEIMKQLNEYNSTVLKQNGLQYIRQSFADIPNAITTISPWIRVLGPEFTRMPINIFLYNIQEIFIHIHTTLSLIIFTFPLFLFVKKKTISLKILLLCGFVYTYIVLSSVLLGYEDFSRLTSASTPLLFIYVGVLIDFGGKYLVHLKSPTIEKTS